MNNVPFELSVSQWFNTEKVITLEQLRGRVVVIGAFQMLCPACVIHSIPQLIRLDQMLPKAQVVVLGLHTVFEHHAAMRPESLEVFIHEYGLKFPVAVDEHASGSTIPQTMQHLRLQGTPSTLLLDMTGHVRLHNFGHIDDLALGVAIGQLLNSDS
jgi:peroxiredoxin